MGGHGDARLPGRGRGGHRARVPPRPRGGRRPRGKIAALRALATGADGPPGREDHPLLHRAIGSARSHRAAWQQLFQIPRSDPRYLAATDDGILADLLDAMYLAGERRRADESVRVVEDYLRNREASVQEDLDFEVGLQPGNKLFDRMLAFSKRSRRKGGETRRVVSIRSGSVSAGKGGE